MDGYEHLRFVTNDQRDVGVHSQSTKACPQSCTLFRACTHTNWHTQY